MSLPPHVVKYSESPVFTEESIPEALRKNHQTKPMVWGQIVVKEGTLMYLRDNRPAQRVRAGENATIYPEEPHSVAPEGDVTFKVEFYREPVEGANQ